MLPASVLLFSIVEACAEFAKHLLVRSSLYAALSHCKILYKVQSHFNIILTYTLCSLYPLSLCEKYFNRYNILFPSSSAIIKMDAAVTLATSMQDVKRNNIADVVSTYSKRLMGFIRRRVNTDADAEDILQDVFYQFIGNTQPIEQVTAWLFRVARNRITDVQRKHKPELLDDIYITRDDDMLGWAELFSDINDNPETAYLRNMFWETLQTALDELPEEQKQVFVMHELEDVSYKDIAEITGASVNTLLSRKRYAVLHLRERLQVLKDELLNY